MTMKIGHDHDGTAAELPNDLPAGAARWRQCFRISDDYNAARALGKQDTLGTIEAGKLADMVLLKADPTRDINNAKLVDTVIKNGQVVDRSKLDLPVNRRPATR